MFCHIVTFFVIYCLLTVNFVILVLLFFNLTTVSVPFYYIMKLNKAKVLDTEKIKGKH